MRHWLPFDIFNFHIFASVHQLSPLMFMDLCACVRVFMWIVYNFVWSCVVCSFLCVEPANNGKQWYYGPDVKHSNNNNIICNIDASEIIFVILARLNTYNSLEINRFIRKIYIFVCNVRAHIRSFCLTIMDTSFMGLCAICTRVKWFYNIIPSSSGTGIGSGRGWSKAFSFVYWLWYDYRARFADSKLCRRAPTVSHSSHHRKFIHRSTTIRSNCILKKASSIDNLF